MSGAGIIALLRVASGESRQLVHDELARTYGRGFARHVRDLVDSDELIRTNEREIRAIKAYRKRADRKLRKVFE